MKELFSQLGDGSAAYLYTVTNGNLTAVISDFGATLVKLFVPDKQGNLADVVLGFDDLESYRQSGSFHGAVVGRNANRIGGAAFSLNGQVCQLGKNKGENNLHSGPDYFNDRLWKVEEVTSSAIRLSLDSPHGDQGFPGNAHIQVTYDLEQGNALRITFEGISDRDTVFNMTNHSYFNLAGHDRPEKAMEQILTMPAHFFTATDAQSIPTGQLQSVEGTAMDFRSPKPLGRDIDAPETQLMQAGGYDHNFQVVANPCAILTDPESGRTMAVSTDCPGMQLYAGNYLRGERGKEGAIYTKRSGVCLETQFFPNAVNIPAFRQPITKAGQPYKSVTIFSFDGE